MSRCSSHHKTRILCFLLGGCCIYLSIWKEISSALTNTLKLSFFDKDDVVANLTAVYKIPKVCYQTWKTKDISNLSSSTRTTILSNQKLNPDIEFVLWDDDDVNHFMRNEYPGRVHNAFKSLNPVLGAARADFFRYCVLLRYGGLYLDIKSIFRTGSIFGKMIRPDDMCVLDVQRQVEVYREIWRYPTYEQWFLAFAPGHPYLQRMVDRLVRNIEARFEPVPVGADGHLPRVSSHAKKKILRLTGEGPYKQAINFLTSAQLNSIGHTTSFSISSCALICLFHSLICYDRPSIHRLWLLNWFDNDYLS